MIKSTETSVGLEQKIPKEPQLLYLGTKNFPPDLEPNYYQNEKNANENLVLRTRNQNRYHKTAVT